MRGGEGREKKKERMKVSVNNGQVNTWTINETFGMHWCIQEGICSDLHGCWTKYLPGCFPINKTVKLN